MTDIRGQTSVFQGIFYCRLGRLDIVARGSRVVIRVTCPHGQYQFLSQVHHIISLEEILVRQAASC